MNGLYDLRYRDPKEGEELPPDNTVNALLKILTDAQKSKEQGDTGQNALLRHMASPDLSFKNFETPVTVPVTAPIPSETAPVITPAASTSTVPEKNALLNIPQVAKKPANSLLDYWAQPVIGKMPLDQFVQLAGSLGHAFGRGPTGIEEPMGVLGGDLARLGSGAYIERARREYEEPTNVLRRRLLEAQIKKAEEKEIPTTWQAFYKEHMGKINLETGRTFTVGEILRAFHAAEAAPEKPSYHYVVDDQGNVSAFAGGKLVSGSGKGATKTPSATGGHYEVNDKGQVSYYEQGKLISGPGTGKTKQAGAGDKLTMTDVKSAYSMDVGNIKSQMMIEMTPDEQMNLAGQPDVNILALLLSGKVGKSLSPEKKNLYIGKLQEVEKYYGDLTNQVLGRKGAKIPEKPAVTPPPPTPEKEIQALPAGSKLIGKSKKTGNPVYKLPDGSTKEVVP